MTTSDWIQLAAVLAAVAAAIIALIVSALDRGNARQIAAADRASELRRAHLLFELEALTRLSENLTRGGASDNAESKRMGAEALTLIGVLSSERLPELWKQRVGSDDQLRAAYADPQMPEYKKNALEVQFAIGAVLREMREEAEAA